MLEIDHPIDAGLDLQQLLRTRRRQRQERHLAFRRFRSDRPDEGQVPHDVADALLDLNDGGGGHEVSIVMPAKAGTQYTPHYMRCAVVPIASFHDYWVTRFRG